ncbi:MAG: LytTR family transcriptional regulator [Bacteroidales bacterium]|nr:LytTR family transcriptional regulator [Bacteroidales bacterium]
MKKRITQLILLLNKENGLFLGIALGVILYVLSFQPFPHREFDFYYRLLFKAGLGAIVFLAMFSVRILYPCLTEKISRGEKNAALFSSVSGFIIWVLSSIAFVFYLRYVGFISITGYLLFKVILICLVPPVILMVSDRMRKLRLENKSVISENESLQKQVDKNEEDYRNISIDFNSGTNGEKSSFYIADILFIKSADNYVELHYKEDNQFKKKLLRNTLTNIELQIKSYTNFVRCHRTCIVNTYFIDKLSGMCNNNELILEGFSEKIPISRQYLLKIKEALF